jgi:hypothetical protein
MARMPDARGDKPLVDDRRARMYNRRCACENAVG